MHTDEKREKLRGGIYEVPLWYVTKAWDVLLKGDLCNNAWRIEYEVSPWGLSWDDEYYYLIGYDSDAGIIKHYRVDKMLCIKVENKVREGRYKFKEPDMVTYDKKMFNMFNGEERNVEILCENSLAGVMIDRFGKDVRITKVDNGHFRVVVKVAASMHFVHWIMALGDGVKIVAPDSLVEQIREEINRLANEYSK